MISLSCSNLSKYFGIDLIIENISFTLSVGDKVGLIGQNGAGKTTLFKILTGQLTTDSGELFFQKGASIGYLAQNVSIDLDTPIFDYCMDIFSDVLAIEIKMREHEAKLSDPNIKDYDSILESYAHLQEEFDRLDGYSVDSKVIGVLNGLAFTAEDRKRPINQLSGGQKSRLNIAKLLLDEPDILLLDEPTNHLDIDSIMWLEDFLKAYSGTVVIISHDRYFLDQIINKTLEIENHNLESYTGNYTTYTKLKKVNYDAKLKEYEKQQKEIKKQEDMVNLMKGRGTEKLAKRARSREKRLQQVVPIDKPMLFEQHFKVSFNSKFKSGKDVLFAKELAMSFGENKLFSNASFEIYRNDRIGLIGPNGVGKTTLFKILLKQLSAKEGSFELGHNVFTGYYDQELKNLNTANDLVEEISDTNPKLTVTEIRTLLGAFLFKGDDVDKKIYDLSGGEKSKLSLLKLMLSESNMLFLDEPTNHLDIISKDIFEDAIKSYDGTVFAISHDRFFLNNVCDKIFELTSDGVNLFLGNYDYYVEKTKEEESLLYDEDIPTITKTQAKSDKKKEKELKKILKENKNKISDLESTIHSNEEELISLQESLCNDEIYKNSDLLIETQRKIKEIENNLEVFYAEWEKLLNEQ